MSKSQQKNEAPETVLLRHPLPKYSFQARKLPREASSNMASVQTSIKGGDHLSKSVMDATSGQWSDSGQKNLSQEAARFTSRENEPHKEASRGNGSDKKSATVRPLPAAPKLEPFSVTAGKAPAKPTATVMASTVKTAFQNPGLGGAHAASLNDLVAAALSRERESRHEESHASGSTAGLQNSQTFTPQEEKKSGNIGMASASALPVSSAGAGIPVPDASLLAYTVEGPGETEKLKKAEQEVAMLKSQLEVQLQVNAELKRLLVASVGEDLERRIENLARDRAELAMEVGDYTKKMTEDYENLDQISIQADMWRTKYLASRVMVEELASGRAFYSAKFHDSQQAMQQLLNERYELRAQMLQAYKCLQQVKEAFDPLNTHRSHGLTSTNVLDLSKSIKQLSEAVRFRLLPAHAGSHVIMPLEDSMESTMTKAEMFAYELLSQQATPPSFKHSVPTAVTPCPTRSFERFHPQVRQDNLTMNCCAHCKGEIKIA
ncbi:hypothetical protein BaRGS_00037115 [Batillaria attramentaria]|uniref:Golgin-45 n=1 Tax=Batillaria attramentaria TaxID=370345 RepID=A0ABD0J9K7_9CAEN